MHPDSGPFHATGHIGSFQIHPSNFNGFNVIVKSGIDYFIHIEKVIIGGEIQNIGNLYTKVRKKLERNIKNSSRTKLVRDELAGDEGFEPPQTESESGVLPLHKSPNKMLRQNASIIIQICVQLSSVKF